MQPDPAPACPPVDDLVAYIDAYLREGPAAAAHDNLRRHLVGCAECAAIVAMAVNGIQWREAQAPGAAALLPEPAWIGLDQVARERYCGD